MQKLKHERQESLQLHKEARAEAKDLGKALEKERNKMARLTAENDRATGDLRVARQEVLDLQDRAKALEREINQITGEKGLGQGALTYTDMASRVKELENEVKILENQRKTVLALNPASGAFEYIGEPLPLRKAIHGEDGEYSDVVDLVKALKAWVKRPTNDRLSILQVFEGLDLSASGEVTPKVFESAMCRLGVQLGSKETELLRQVLDPRHVGYLSYRALVRELQGVPQQDFMHKVVNKLARVAVDRDLSEAQFLSLVDPNTRGTMTLEAFQASMAQSKAADFNFSEDEVTALFHSLAVSDGSHAKFTSEADSRTVGLRLKGYKLKVQQLGAEVFAAVQALLVEQVRVAFGKAKKTVAQVFAKYDANKDGFLERAELQQALADCDLRLETNMRAVLLDQVLDPPPPSASRGSSRMGDSASAGKISVGILKFYLEAGGAQDVDALSVLSRSRGVPSHSGRAAAPEHSATSAAPVLSFEAL